MSGARREKDTEDYDLERFVEMFDQALTSDDPRVKNALRQLMMMVILTDTDDHEGQCRASRGPLRRTVEDIANLSRRMQSLENALQSMKYQDRSQSLGQQVPDGYRLGPLSGSLPMQTASEINEAAIQKAQYAMYDREQAEQVAKKINGGTI